MSLREENLSLHGPGHQTQTEGPVSVSREPQETLFSQALYLTFDVDPTERVRFCRLEQAGGLPSQEPNTIVSLPEEGLAAMFTNESSALVVRFEAELLSKEAKLYIRFVSGHRISVKLLGWANRLTLYTCWTVQLDARG